ncbi:MAG: amidohydrolase [Saprospiraceae bacterium]|nr:amidohydrolase [Saprospiraceae bacterium]
MINKIKSLANSISDEVIDIRRHLHTYPELSFQEFETSKFIEDKLLSYGINQISRCAENGIVAIISGKNPEKNCIALRADMDALPILEQNDVPYRSVNDGVMHACGHDMHTSSLLGVAKILNLTKDDWEGTIKLIFQPAEEKLPGGASIMIHEGVLENPKPSLIIGQHVHPPLETGKIGIKSGVYMASADEIYVTVKGKGGHGALPQDCVDPILVSAHIITALQQIVSRNANPTIPSVLTFGKINSTGGATNVIPNEVKIDGTFRTFDEEWRFSAHKKMKKMASLMAESMGATCDFDIIVGYPVLKNDEHVSEKVRSYAKEFIGESNVVDLPIRMTAEDFAYYSHKIPAAFYRIGTGNKEKNTHHALHTPTFNIDEDAIPTSIGLMSYLAIAMLGEF